MALSAMTPIATVTLANNFAYWAEFSSIPSNFKDLRIVFTAASSANSNNIMRLNGDTNANYTQVYAGGNGSTPTSGTIGSSSFVGTDSSAFTTTVVGETVHVIDILNYSSTNQHKTMLFRANRAGGHVEMMAGRWASLDAVNTIRIQPYTSWYTWLAGSTFTLYGISG